VRKSVLAAAEYFFATTDMWSSVGTIPYLSPKYLQTAFMPEDHSSDNLTVALAELRLSKYGNGVLVSNLSSPLTTVSTLARSKSNWVRFGHICI